MNFGCAILISSVSKFCEWASLAEEYVRDACTQRCSYLALCSCHGKNTRRREALCQSFLHEEHAVTLVR